MQIRYLETLEEDVWDDQMLFWRSVLRWSCLQEFLLHEANQPVVASFQLTSSLRSSILNLLYHSVWWHVKPLKHAFGSPFHSGDTFPQDIGWIPSWETGRTCSWWCLKLKRHQIALQRNNIMLLRHIRELYSRYIYVYLGGCLTNLTLNPVVEILQSTWRKMRVSKWLLLRYGSLPWVAGPEGFANDPLERLATKDEIIHRQDC